MEKETAERLVSCLKRYTEESGTAFAITEYRNPIVFLEQYRAVFDVVFI